MPGPIVRRYVTQFAISLSIAVLIVALRVEKSVINILFIALGSFFSIVFLDLDYIVQAYWNDPDSPFSKGLRDLVRQQNYKGALTYIALHKYSIQKRLIHSALFQVILLVSAIMVAAASEHVFGIALSLSAFANLMYQMFDELEEKGSVSDWFWVLKNEPKKTQQKAYLVVILLLSITVVLFLPR